MADNPIDLFFDGTTSPDGLRDLMLEVGAYVTTATDVPNTVWAPVGALIVDGVVFAYDPTDVISAHDGTAVLVSSDGRRYKATLESRRPFAVLDIVETPPVSPAIGDAYLVGAAPTGVFAAKADDLAIYTRNGWQFVDALNLLGASIYCEADDTTYQLTGDGWRAGFGAATVSEGALDTTHFGSAVGRYFHIENQTTNTPPTSPADQVAYIVGPSPTGAWAGKQAQVVVRLGGEWVFMSPAEGWLAWDKAQDRLFVYYGGVWADALAVGQTIRGMANAYTTVSATLTVVGLANGSGSTIQYVYSDGAAPTTDHRRVVASSLAVTLTASAASRKLLFEWDGFDAKALAATTHDPCIAIFRDSETSALLWLPISVLEADVSASNAVIGVVMPRRGFVLSDDGASHTYTLAITTSLSLGATYALPKGASFSVTEVP